MDFAPTEERRMLADSLGRYLDERYAFPERNRAAYGEVGYSPAHWSALAELGTTAMLFDEAAGGLGGSGFDIATVFEAIGRSLVVEPFLGTLMAGRALAMGGERAELAGIVAGEVVAAFAHDEPAGDAPETIATQATCLDDGGWRLDGAKSVVPHAEAAALFVVTARTPTGISAFAVPSDAAGLDVRGYANVDGGRSGELTLRGVSVPAASLIGEEGGGVPIVRAATQAGLLALSAEALGAMEAARDTTLGYLRTRTQFGTGVGRFQALQHRMVDVALEIEQARSAVINAAAAFDGTDDHERARAVHAAKHTIGRAGTLVAEEAIQLHGGIGMTWDLPVAHYAKRLTMIDHQLGDADEHLQAYIALGRQGVATP